MYKINFYKMNSFFSPRKEYSTIVNEKKYFGDILKEKNINSKYVYFKNVFYQKNKEEWNFLINQDILQEQLNKSFVLYNKKEIDLVIFSELKEGESDVETICDLEFLTILDILNDMTVKYCVKNAFRNKNILKKIFLDEIDFDLRTIYRMNSNQLYFYIYRFYYKYTFSLTSDVKKSDIENLYKIAISKNYKCYNLFFLFSLIEKNVYKNFFYFLKWSKLSVKNGGSYNPYEEVMYHIAENMTTLLNVENILLKTSKLNFFKAYYVLCLFYHAKKNKPEFERCVFELKKKGSIHINIILSHIHFNDKNYDKEKILKYLKSAEKYQMVQSVVYLAFFYNKINDVRESILYYKKTQNDQRYVFDLYHHGSYYYEKKNFKLMNLCFDIAIKMGCEKSAFRMGLYYMEPDNYNLSKMTYFLEKSFSLGNRDALYQLGIFYKKNNLHQEMVYYFNKNLKYHLNSLCSNFTYQDVVKYKSVLLCAHEIGVYRYTKKEFGYFFDYIYFSALKGLEESFLFIIFIVKKLNSITNDNNNNDILNLKHCLGFFKNNTNMLVLEKLMFLKNNYFKDDNYRSFVLEYYIRNNFKNALKFLKKFFKKRKNILFNSIPEGLLLKEEYFKKNMLSNIYSKSDIFFKYN